MYVLDDMDYFLESCIYTSLAIVYDKREWTYSIYFRPAKKTSHLGDFLSLRKTRNVDKIINPRLL